MRSSLVFWALLSAMPVMAQQRNPLPNWGGLDPVAYVVGAWEFQPNMGNEPQLIRMGGVQRGGVAAGSYYAAHVHLPSGAKVAGMEITGCDNSATTELEVSLYAVDPTGAVQSHGLGGSGLATTGCTYYPVGVPNFNVDNLNFTYIVLVTLGDPVNTFSNVRIYYVLEVSPAPATATFSDVPTSHVFFKYIEALAKSGITAGCTAPPNPNYCPDAPLTRGQMAVFLSRAFGLHWAY